MGEEHRAALGTLERAGWRVELRAEASKQQRDDSPLMKVCRQAGLRRIG